MKILLTGASSFTGLWFVSALVAAGHQVTAPLHRKIADYEGLRRQRVDRVAAQAEVVEDCRFGGERFLQLLTGGAFDVLCHHAANVTNYRSPDFDVAAALHDNTFNLPAVLRLGRERGLKAVVLTGSCWEAHESCGEEPLRAFNPYALSKGLTSEVFRFRCAEAGLPLAKFVIPNPFGAWEEPRFCAYLLRCWTAGKTAGVNTPAYVRDNIPVSLLAAAYADWVARTVSAPAFSRLAPSGYVESQGAFARRFAEEIGRRLGIATPLSLARQTEFPEPMMRVNRDRPDEAALGWDEERAWDELADYYRSAYPLAS